MIATLPALCGFAFLAGFIDSIAGGGGLIQLPALLVLLPETSVATLFGTNKLASIWGTLYASARYLRSVSAEWNAILPTAVTALAFAFIGARTITLIEPRTLRPMVLALLVLVLVYTLWKKDFGRLHAPRLMPETQRAVGLVTGAVIGFYDGFFGPGTGSFLIFAFVGVFGFNFLAASAAAKTVNVITNFAAIAWFVSSGHVLYSTALPMAAANLTGSVVGTRLALKHGSGFVRVLFVIVVGALIARFGYTLMTSD